MRKYTLYVNIMLAVFAVLFIICGNNDRQSAQHPNHGDHLKQNEGELQ